jgi:hypothetical protein
MNASLSYSCENWSLILLVSAARVQTELKKQNLNTTSHEPPGKFPLAKAGVQGRDFSFKMGFQKIRRLPHAKDQDDSPKNDYTDDQIKIVELGPGTAVFRWDRVAAGTNAAGPNRGSREGSTRIARPPTAVLAAGRDLPFSNAAAQADRREHSCSGPVGMQRIFSYSTAEARKNSPASRTGSSTD